jgi:hypothetical protein
MNCFKFTHVRQFLFWHFSNTSTVFQTVFLFQSSGRRWRLLSWAFCVSFWWHCLFAALSFLTMSIVLSSYQGSPFLFAAPRVRFALHSAAVGCCRFLKCCLSLRFRKYVLVVVTAYWTTGWGGGGSTLASLFRTSVLCSVCVCVCARAHTCAVRGLFM